MAGGGSYVYVYVYGRLSGLARMGELASSAKHSDDNTMVISSKHGSSDGDGGEEPRKAEKKT